MKMFENAKIGDKVWDIRLGWGEIIEIGYTILYPITVKFDSIIDKYTFEGKWAIKDKFPTLFWNEFKIPEKAFKKPLPNLEIDAKVLVRSEEETEWHRRHFAGWTENNQMKCWTAGATSWSVENYDDYLFWDKWKLPEEE